MQINSTEVKTMVIQMIYKALGSVMVKVLCYMSEGRGFETRCGDLILPTALGPGLYSASNRNEYQKQKNNVSGE
jgi:hypothetical protein